MVVVVGVGVGVGSAATTYLETKGKEQFFVFLLHRLPCFFLFFLFFFFFASLVTFHSKNGNQILRSDARLAKNVDGMAGRTPFHV